MTFTANLGKLALVATAVALVGSTASAAAKPDATIRFHGGSVALLAGVNWGGGTLHFKGKDIPLKVSGLSIGQVGAAKFDASGEVFNLKQASDIEGTYAAGAASATVGGGAGALSMKNGNGVVINTTSTSAGLNLKLGPSGVTIKLK